MDMREAFEREFQNDPIYKMCLINNLTEDELFPQSILSIHHEASYGTVEVGRILGRPDSTIRNHFRTDLVNYVAPERFGKYYRMDWKSVFRLHLIFLLIELRGKTTVDILVELGEEASVAVSNYHARKGTVKRTINEVGPSDDLAKKVEGLTKMVEQILNTGLFEMKVNENGQNQITLKEEYTPAKVKSLSDNNDKIEQLIRENEERNKDVAISIKENRLRSKVERDLQYEALKMWTETNKLSLFSSFSAAKREEYELNKVKFINEYVENNINERLKKEYTKKEPLENVKK